MNKMNPIFFFIVFFCFKVYSQSASPSNYSDTNFFFVSSEYECTCTYDSTLKFNFYVKRSIAEMNANRYLKFDLEHSTYGTRTSIYLKKVDHSYLMLADFPDTTFEYPLFTFDEKIDQFHAYPSYSIFGLGSIRKENTMENSGRSMVLYKLEGADTESEYISSIYFDHSYNVLGFSYYGGKNNYQCNRPFYEKDFKKKY